MQQHRGTPCVFRSEIRQKHRLCPLEFPRTDHIRPHAPTAYDLVIVEFNINDIGLGTDDRIAYKTEILLRALLGLSYSPMVLYLELGWDYGGRGAKRISPHYGAAVNGHERMLLYYQIPTVSTFHSLWPIQMYDKILHIVPESNLTHYDRGNMAWFADWCCHPSDDHHKWAALNLAFAFYVEHFKMSSEPDQVANFEFDAKGRLPPIWMTTPEDQQRYKTLEGRPLSDYPLERPQWDTRWNTIVHLGGDWKLNADQSKEGVLKWGLIATQKHSELAFRVNVTKFINVEYLETYENIGIVAVWIDEAGGVLDGGPGARRQCDHLGKELVSDLGRSKVATDGQQYFVLDPVKEDRVSVGVQQVVMVEVDPPGRAKQVWVHFCLPTEDRFKLLHLTAY